jgi:xanthine dehydrogenase accessory factor
MLATPGHLIAGSVSGGCVEGATADAIVDAIARGAPRRLEFGVTDETAWSVGLACGGTIRILVEPAIRPELATLSDAGAVLATVLSPANLLGYAFFYREDGAGDGPLPPAGSGTARPARALQLPGDVTDQVRHNALAALAEGRSRAGSVAQTGGSELEVFYEVFPRQAKLVMFGGVHIAAALVPLANVLGFRTIVADGREAFLTRDRFPEAHELVHGWPEEAFRRIGLDAETYVCVLTHDPKFDDPALQIALRSSAPYVGAIGSQGTQQARRERLRHAGITEEQLGKLRGPIGLDLGGREPAEIALAILSEVVAVRRGGTGAAKTR